MLDAIEGRPKEFAGSGTLPTPADLRVRDLAYDITTGITYEYDGTSPIVVGGWAATSTAGAGHVAIRPITNVDGTLNSHFMGPGDLALTGAETAEIIWSSATGCKAWWIEPLGAVGAASLLAASSITVSDGVALATLLNTADGEFDVPTGAPNDSVIVLTAQGKDYPKQIYDGTDTIKTIAIRASQAAFTGQAVLYTVE